MARLVLAAVAFLAAVGIAVGVLLFSLDAIVARAIEQRGSELTGTDVEVDSVNLEIRAGSGTISGLRVGNPEGFSPEAALELSDIQLVLDASSATESPLPIRELRVGRSRIRLELSESGRSNLDSIRRHARERPEEAPPSGGEEAPRRFRIAKLRFEGGEVLLEIPDRDEPESVELPGFELRDVGGGPGATGAEIGERALQELARRAAVVAAGDQLGRALGEELGEAGRAAGKLFEKLLD